MVKNKTIYFTFKLLFFLLFQATMHVYVRSDGLASVVISNNEYLKRVAHSLLSKVRIFIERYEMKILLKNII
jgi:hypothetical protein